MARKISESVVDTRERRSLADLPDIANGKDLQAVFGIPASTWRYWAYAGQGPAFFKLGKHRLYRREAVLAWLAEAEAAD